MLRRFSSLILALAIGSSVLAGTVRPSNKHVCMMAGMGIMPGVEMMDHRMEMMDHDMETPGMHMPTAAPPLAHSHEMMPGMQMPTASPALSQSHEMMPGMQMSTASPALSASHEMMPGMQMPRASPALRASHEMMPGMHMPTASSSLSASHELMPGMETMPCCKKHKTQSLLSECCINIPQETGSSGTTFTLRPPSFSVAVIHPAIVQPPITAPKPYEFLYSAEVFLPNLQTSYLRNLSFLI